MKLGRSGINAVLAGSTILGTGGGGRYDAALQSAQELGSIELITIDDVPSGTVVLTAYGAGGLLKPPVTEATLWRGLGVLQRRLGKKVGAIIPVEIGPYSLAEAFKVAAKLGVPVVDGDLVGCRSVPEIFVELVTLAKLPRCPLVFGNEEGDLVLLENDSTPERLEAIIRSFADMSASNTFVLGYPFTKTQLRRGAAAGSVSYCLQVRERLLRDFRLIGSGTVMKDMKQEVSGFTRGYLEIGGPDARYTVEYKNEYLVLSKSNQVVVTCPEFILVVDEQTGLGLNNGEENTGKRVQVLIGPAIPQWRTAAARKLFSPQALGLPYRQKVMKDRDE